MHAQRHMHLYGTTRAQLGLGGGQRANDTWRGTPWCALSGASDDRRLSRGAADEADPLGLYDCDVPVDAACAFVVPPLTPLLTGRSRRCACRRRRVVSISPAAGCAGPTIHGWRRRTWRRAVEPGRARATRSRLRQLYDGFSFLTLVWLEALGICGEGESGAYVEGGERIDSTGELPLNTYGGQSPRGACTATGCCTKRARSCGARPARARCRTTT